MYLLFRGHRTWHEDGAPPQSTVNFCLHYNRGKSPDPSIFSKKLDSDSHQPKLCAAAAQRTARLSTRKTGCCMRKSKLWVRTSSAEVNVPGQVLHHS